MSPKTEHRQQNMRVTIPRDKFDGLFAALSKRGYTIVGPTLRHGVIIIDTLKSSADLPAGWTEEGAPGKYRTAQRKDGALFGFTVGAHSWKKYLHPPVLRLMKAKRSGKAFLVDEVSQASQKMAFLGVRACDLNAIDTIASVLQRPPYADPGFRSRRSNSLIIAVNCSQATGTCFCVSMGTGPRAAAGFDLALTEILARNQHYFLAESGSDLGREILKDVPHADAGEDELKAAERVSAAAAAQMGRSVNVAGIESILERNFENQRWADVAKRCLTCTNCTMVCPTCFCTTVEDTTDLAGITAERIRKWDSCFTLDFSYIHGGSVRSSGMSRYRQWLTHKFSSWKSQFGRLGCVGCGRCIAWCPAGIDVTEELAAIRKTDMTTSIVKEKQ